MTRERRLGRGLEALLGGMPSPVTPTVPGETAEPTAPVGPENTSPTQGASPSGEAPVAGLQPPPPIAAVVPSTRYVQVVLTGLREEIRPGLLYEIDLTFERAGVVKVALPVAYPAKPREPAEHAK